MQGNLISKVLMHLWGKKKGVRYSLYMGWAHKRTENKLSSIFIFLKESSRFLPFLPNFSSFFPIFSWFFPIFGQFFAIRGGTLPPLAPILATPLLEMHAEMTNIVLITLCHLHSKGGKYISSKQLPLVSHSDLKKDSAQLLLSNRHQQRKLWLHHC